MPDRQLLDLEIKDAQVIFKNVWETLEEEIGHENLRFPKELILLGGAPGSGKGTQTQFIMGVRGLTCPPIVVSSLLTTPAAKAIKDAGGLVGDKEVFEILLHKLLEPPFRDGAVLDGFPRTKVQVCAFGAKKGIACSTIRPCTVSVSRSARLQPMRAAAHWKAESWG